MAVRVEVSTFGTEPVRFETLAALSRRGAFQSVISHPVSAGAAGTAIANVAMHSEAECAQARKTGDAPL